MFCGVTVGHYFLLQDKSYFLPYLSRFKFKKIYVECNLTVTEPSLGTALWQGQRNWEYFFFWSIQYCSAWIQASATV